MTAEAPAPGRLPPGHCGVRLRLFGTAAEELRDTMRPPWPRWMRRLYEMQEATDSQTDVAEGVVSIPAAVSALKDKLAHRLDVLAWVVEQIAELGWEIELDGDTLMATARLSPAEARRLLEAEGVAGPMSLVTELDASGWPRIWSGDASVAAP